MNEHVFAAGDEVFLEDGSVASYIASAGASGHIVQSIYERDDGEPWLGDARRVSLVFKKAPTPRFHEQIAELAKRVDALTAEVGAKRAELTDIGQKIAAQSENLRRFGVLETLDDLLAGRITHILTISWNRDEVRIVPIEQAAKDDRGWGSLTALTLKASTTKAGEVSWSFERDGGFRGFLLFRSHDAALVKAKEHIEARTKMWLGGKSDVSADLLEKSCRALGIEAHPRLKAAVATRERATAEARVAEARRHLDVAVAQLNALPAQVRA